MTALLEGLRHGVRTLLRRPLFVLLVWTTLAALGRAESRRKTTAWLAAGNKQIFFKEGSLLEMPAGPSLGSQAGVIGTL